MGGSGEHSGGHAPPNTERSVPYPMPPALRQRVGLEAGTAGQIRGGRPEQQWNTVVPAPEGRMSTARVGRFARPEAEMRRAGRGLAAGKQKPACFSGDQARYWVCAPQEKDGLDASHSDSGQSS